MNVTRIKNYKHKNVLYKKIKTKIKNVNATGRKKDDQ